MGAFLKCLALSVLAGSSAFFFGLVADDGRSERHIAWIALGVGTLVLCTLLAVTIFWRSMERSMEES